MSAKCRFSVCVIFWVILSFGSFWGALVSFDNYFSFGTRIVFSPFSLSLPLMPIILFFPCIYWFMVVRHGEKLAIKKCKGINKVFIFILVGYVFLAVVFVVFYKNHLVSQGYLICPGNPRGWTIGMATEYVRSLSDCVK